MTLNYMQQVPYDAIHYSIWLVEQVVHADRSPGMMEVLALVEACA